MKFKLIMTMVEDSRTDTVVEAAREAGATGATTITSVRGEGLNRDKTFLGLDLSGQRDIVLFLVAETKARTILEKICEAGGFDKEPGAGVAIQISIEDAVGLQSQLPKIIEEVEEEV